MTPQQITNKIAELEEWLRANPNHENRTIIETDLRKLRSTDSSRAVPIERDTFDLREHNFYNV